MPTPSRADHLQWCKDRALEYLDPGPHFSINDALASFASDMLKHPETKDHPALLLGFQMQMAGLLDTVPAARKWILDFN